MRTQINEDSLAVWINADETYAWGQRWPCSGFRGKRIFAAFDSNGLCDYTVNGKEDDGNIDGTAFSCCIADHLHDSGKLGVNHPCYDVVVGQFLVEGEAG